MPDMHRLLRMSRRSRLLAIVAILFGATACLPPVQWQVIGWVKGEAFYQGQPTSYWAWRIRAWREAANERTVTSAVPNAFVRLRMAVGLADDPPQFPKICLGDPAAIPVLCELADATDPVVVKAAACGLGQCSPKDARAQQALERLLTHEDESVRQHAEHFLGLAPILVPLPLLSPLEGEPKP